MHHQKIEFLDVESPSSVKSNPFDTFPLLGKQMKLRSISRKGLVSKKKHDYVQSKALLYVLSVIQIIVMTSVFDG